MQPKPPDAVYRAIWLEPDLVAAIADIDAVTDQEERRKQLDREGGIELDEAEVCLSGIRAQILDLTK